MSRLLLAGIAMLMCSSVALSADKKSVKAPDERLVREKSAKMGWTGILSEEEFKALHALREGAAPELHGEMVELAGGHAYLSLPSGDAPHPGIVVIQEWWGLNENIKHWSDRLAADGYAALAIDLYDSKVATTPEEAMKYVNSVQDERGYEILRAAVRFLREDARVKATKLGSIGWCYGGGWSLRLALSEPDLDAAVIYYGRLVDDPEELGKIGAKICGIFGNADQGIPPPVVDGFEKGLNEAGVTYELHRYDADHAFANPSSARYNEESAEAAWKKVRAFLAANLKTL